MESALPNMPAVLRARALVPSRKTDVNQSLKGWA
jgi:hypothetical protein